MYTRARANVTNPNTPRQQAVRNALSSLSQAWTSTLSQVQRESWSTYASNVSIINTLGAPINISGLAMFIRCNSPRSQAGQALVLDGPTTYTLGTFTPITAILNHSTGWAATYDNTDEWATNTGGLLLFYTSRPQSVGINFFKGPFQYAGGIPGNTITPPTPPATVNPTVPYAAGQKGFLRIQATLADGRLSSSQIVTAVAT